jgi:HEAT repeat protein
MPLVMVLVIVVACGPRDPAGETVRLIIEELSAQRFGSATARYRQNEELVLSAAAAPAWRRGLEHQDPTVREWSVDALARIGEPQDTARVVAALDDPFRRVQEGAARRLVELDAAVAAEAFIERLASDDPLAMTSAAQGHADHGDPAGAEPLIERFRDGRLDAAVRRILAQALAALGDPRAVAPLAAVAGDPAADLALRRDAVEALAAFETEEATEALRGLLGADDTYVQEVARRAIAARR